MTDRKAWLKAVAADDKTTTKSLRKAFVLFQRKNGALHLVEDLRERAENLAKTLGR